MKLRNKKTDEIIDFDSITDTCFGSKIQLQSTERYNKPIYIYNSLAELNEEWEDYEEAKESWHIDFDGTIMNRKDIKCEESVFEAMETIGNYFASKEEAEKAVEKLKAWKRLKEDLNFEFESWSHTAIPFGQVICLRAMCDDAYVTMKKSKQLYRDLDLLFGGEEC